MARADGREAVDGTDMAVLAAKGFAFVDLQRVSRPGAKILLAGYSRGGAGVIAVAARLARQNIQVSAMALFDPVDRAIGIGAAEIPNNVRRVLYARRDPTVRSRHSFGNCGTRWRPPTRMEMRTFRGTHGALGGVPWKAPNGTLGGQIIDEGLPELTSTTVTYEQDGLAARAVWSWVAPRLGSMGFFGATGIAGAKL